MLNLPKVHGSNSDFYLGVVETIDDSKAKDGLKLGRVQVRVMGLHSPHYTSDEKTGEGIDPKDLIWAYPVMPNTGSSMSGLGESPSSLIPGCWVILISFDGQISQEFFIMGTIFGYTAQKPYNSNFDGFSDPDGKFPKDSWVGESDVHRLARNENIGKTLVADKNADLDDGVMEAFGGSWSQPSSPYNALYPYNIVREGYSVDGERGNTIEIDNTPGAQRLASWHPSKSFTEIDVDGTKVTKNKKDFYHITEGNSYTHTRINRSETTESNHKRLVNGNDFLSVNVSRSISIGINKFEKIFGNSNKFVMMNELQETIMNKVSGTLMNEIKAVGMNNISLVGMNEIKYILMNRIVNTMLTSTDSVLIDRINITGFSEYDFIGVNKSEIVGVIDAHKTSNKAEYVTTDKIIYIHDNKQEHVGLDSDQDIFGDKNVRIDGNYTIDVGGTLTIRANKVNVETTKMDVYSGDRVDPPTPTPIKTNWPEEAIFNLVQDIVP